MTDFPRIRTGGVERLIAETRETRRMVRDMRSNLLRAAGLRLQDGVLRVLGSLVVEGDLDVPNGSITNDALQSPVAYLAGLSNSYSIAISATETVTSSFALSVPDGYSRALVVISGQAGLYNGTGATASAAMRLRVDTSAGAATWSGSPWQDVPDATDVALSSMWQDVMTVAGGQTMTFKLFLQGAPAWGSASGFVTLNGYALFTR